MDITPIIRTFHNKKGKTIQVLKKEIMIATEEGMQSIAKNIRSVTYDNNLKPISCRETTWHKGKILQADVYQRANKQGLLLKQGVGKNAKKTIFDHLNLEEIAAKFLK